MNFFLYKYCLIPVFCSDDCVYIAHADIFDSIHSLRGNSFRNRCRQVLADAGFRDDDALKNYTHYSKYPMKLNRVQRECITLLRQLATRGSIFGEEMHKRTEAGHQRLALHFYLHIQKKYGSVGNNFLLSSIMDGIWTYKKGQGIVYHRY